MLFNNNFIQFFLNQELIKIKEEIENEDEKYLVNVKIEEYTQYLIEKYNIIHVTLLKEQIFAKEGDIEITCSSNFCGHGIYGRLHYIKVQRFEYFIPFDGDSRLFFVKPSVYRMWNSSNINVNIETKEIYFIIDNNQKNINYVNQEYTNTISLIEEHLQNMKQNINSFNNSLSMQIKQLYNTRRIGILKRWDMASQSIVPIIKQENSSSFNIDLKKIKPIIIKPTARDKIFPQKFEISNETYYQILNIINGIGINFTKLPSTSLNKGEEQLRDHILVILQSHFKNASAVGEAFNGLGKTDILIKHNDNNVFIAECKFWSGQSNYLESINQLLGYLTWSDTKAALIIFVKEKNFSNILQKIKDASKKHSNFLQVISFDENIFRYVFHINGDKERKFNLSVMVYNIPSSNN